MKYLPLTLSLAAALTLSACKEEAAPQVNNNEAPNPHAAQTTKAAASSHQGIVKETMATAGYSYVLVDLGDDELWLAGPQTELAPGTTVFWDEGAMMSNFTSSTLDRTFEKVLFVSRLLSEQEYSSAQANAPQGTVKSVEHAAGYVYLEVTQSTGTVWVAAPDADISVDDTVTWSNASLMNGFHSSSLDRTFDAIYFAGSVAKL